MQHIETFKIIAISIYFIFNFRKLLVNPKDRRVVVVESVLNSYQKREVLANVLFKHFEVIPL